VVESVDLLVPIAPALLQIGGKAHLVHELHLTNFLPVEISLSRIQVKAVTPAEASIADYSGTELSNRIGRPGLLRNHSDPQVVGPGMRAVLYVWAPLPDDSVAPRTLGHRVELEIIRPTGRVTAAVEGAVVSVAADKAVVLDPPLRGGPWVAIYSPLLKGGHRTAVYTLGGRARIPSRFAIDWIRLPAGGVMDTPTPPPPDWNGYGAEVLAVADGVVAAAFDDVDENLPGASAPVALENASGNYVALDLGRGRFAFYEHLKRGSVAVKAGDRVKSGQVIGRLGNSGSSSIGPHLHFHVSDAGSPLAAEGLPFVLSRFDHLGAFTSIEALVGGERWIARPEGPADVRTHEMPGPNSAVQFR
jgi:murein DD-endopeptidase